MSQKDFVLFINSIHAPTYSALCAHGEKTGRILAPLVIVDKTIQKPIHVINNQDHLYGNATIITADFTSPASIRHALRPYEGRIFAVTSQYENSIPEFKKVIPHLPHLHAPTETSLDWSTDKKLMREAFNAHDPSLSPKSMRIKDASPATIAAIERFMPSYPLIVKPSGLERSLLVSAVHDRQELAATLTHTFKQIQEAYRTRLKRFKPVVLVEELMEGDMYSVDTYVSADGACRHAPPVKVITGRNIGFEDFFAYLQMSPADLSADELKQAYDTAGQACRALGLRSVTAHTEMMKTPNGWKIIEVGPRIGGYRHELYALSHGMNHIVNDILNRAGELPEIPKKPQRYAAIFKTYPHEEGLLEAITGLDIVEKLQSFVAMKLPYAKGDELKFAHNNGDAAVEVTLCHQDAGQLHADIRTLEKSVYIHTRNASISTSALEAANTVI